MGALVLSASLCLAAPAAKRSSSTQPTASTKTPAKPGLTLSSLEHRLDRQTQADPQGESGVIPAQPTPSRPRTFKRLSAWIRSVGDTIPAGKWLQGLGLRLMDRHGATVDVQYKPKKARAGAGSLDRWRSEPPLELPNKPVVADVSEIEAAQRTQQLQNVLAEVAWLEDGQAQPDSGGDALLDRALMSGSLASAARSNQPRATQLASRRMMDFVPGTRKESGPRLRMRDVSRLHLPEASGGELKTKALELGGLRVQEDTDFKRMPALVRRRPAMTVGSYVRLPEVDAAPEVGAARQTSQETIHARLVRGFGQNTSGEVIPDPLAQRLAQLERMAEQRPEATLSFAAGLFTRWTEPAQSERILDLVVRIGEQQAKNRGVEVTMTFIRRFAQQVEVPELRHRIALRIGRLYYEHGAYAKAIAELNIDLDEDDADEYQGLAGIVKGVSLIRVNRPDQALLVLEWVAEHSPDRAQRVKSAFLLGRLYQLYAKPEPARKWLQYVKDHAQKESYIVQARERLDQMGEEGER